MRQIVFDLARRKRKLPRQLVDGVRIAKQADVVASKHIAPSGLRALVGRRLEALTPRGHQLRARLGVHATGVQPRFVDIEHG